MLQALNTGHDGSMSTIHANGAADALARLETLVLLADSGLPLAAVRAQIGASIDAVVFVARRPHGVRRVEAIAEVDGAPGRVGCGRCSNVATQGLVPVGRPTRPARRPEASAPTGLGGVVGAVLTLVLAVVGPIACARARRAAAQPCRGRRSGAATSVPRSRWRVPTRSARSAVSRRCTTPTSPCDARAGGRALGDRRGSRSACWRPRSRRRWRARRARGCAVAGPVGAPRSLGHAASGASPRRCPPRSSRSRPSCGVAARWRRRSNGSPTPAARSVATSAACTCAPSSGCRSSDALAGWPQEHDAPGVRAAAGALVGGGGDGRAGRRRDRRAGRVAAVTGSTRWPRPAPSRRRRGSRRSWSARRRSGTSRSRALVDPASVTALVDTGVGRVCLVVGLGLGGAGRAVDPPHRRVGGVSSPMAAVVAARPRVGRAAGPADRAAGTPGGTGRTNCRARRRRPTGRRAEPGSWRGSAPRRPIARGPSDVCSEPCTRAGGPGSTTTPLARELPVVVDLLGVAVGAGCTPYLAVEVAARWSPAMVGRAARRRAALRARSGSGSTRALDDAAPGHARAPPAGRRAPRVRPVWAHRSAPTLARLADEERTALRRRAEAHARRVPVRLLFPLVFLVLPAFVLLTVVPGLASRARTALTAAVVPVARFPSLPRSDRERRSAHVPIVSSRGSRSARDRRRSRPVSRPPSTRW